MDGADAEALWLMCRVAAGWEVPPCLPCLPNVCLLGGLSSAASWGSRRNLLDWEVFQHVIEEEECGPLLCPCCRPVGCLWGWPGVWFCFYIVSLKKNKNREPGEKPHPAPHCSPAFQPWTFYNLNSFPSSLLLLFFPSSLPPFLSSILSFSLLFSSFFVSSLVYF